MNNSTTDINPTAHLMFIQSRAHHEDRIIHSRPTIDNKLKDFSHLLRPTIPSKKNYINKEKVKKINQDNVNLLSKIYKITFDKNNEPVGKYGAPAKSRKEEVNGSIELHPFSSDHRSRSLNNANRRKELEKINKDNSQLLNKLRTMKSTVPNIGQCKQRKKKLEYLKQLIHKRDEDQKNRALQPYINQRMKGDSVLNQYIHRHEQVSRRNSMTTNHETIYITNENHESGVNLKVKNVRRGKRAHSREGSIDEKNTVQYALNSSEIISRSVDPDFLSNNANNYQTGSNKKGLLPPVAPNSKKKALEELDKKLNLDVSPEASVQEPEIQEEVEQNALKSIREGDIKEEISHDEGLSTRENGSKNSKSLNKAQL